MGAVVVSIATSNLQDITVLRESGTVVHGGVLPTVFMCDLVLRKISIVLGKDTFTQRAHSVV